MFTLPYDTSALGADDECTGEGVNEASETLGYFVEKHAVLFNNG